MLSGEAICLTNGFPVEEFEADSLNTSSGIPKDEVKRLQQALKHRSVRWTRSEIMHDEKQRDDAVKYIFECRERAGVPVQDRTEYDGSKIVRNAQCILPDIMSGKDGKQKAVETVVEGRSKAEEEESHLIQQGGDACEDVSDGTGDGKTRSSPDL